eukprot:2457904-Pleurochrysis_carterae.AAC.5
MQQTLIRSGHVHVSFSVYAHLYDRAWLLVGLSPHGRGSELKVVHTRAREVSTARAFASYATAYEHTSAFASASGMSPGRVPIGACLLRQLRSLALNHLH